MVWKDITLTKYLEMTNKLSSKKDLTDNEFYSIILDRPLDLDNLTLMERFSILEEAKYFSTDVLNVEPSPILEIDGEVYYVNKNFNMLSFKQFANYEYYYKKGFEEGNCLNYISDMLAIVILPAKKYDDELADKLSEKIKMMDIETLSPAISFFLSKENESEQSILACLNSLIMKEITNLEEATKKAEKNLIAHGAGMELLSRWQMNRYLKSIKSFVYELKKC